MSNILTTNDKKSAPQKTYVAHKLSNVLRYANINLFGGKEFFTHTTIDHGNIHQHNFFEISYAVRGTIKHVTPNSETLLSNNTFLLLRPDDAHAFDEELSPTNYHRDILVSVELFKVCCDFISPTLYDKIMATEGLITVPFSPDDFKSLESSLKFFYTIDKDDTEKMDSLGKSIVCYFLLLYVKNMETQALPNKQAIDEILSAMQTPNVLQNGIPALVKEVNYSHGHLCRLIKQHTGKKLLDVLTEIRMDQAALHLRASDYSLLDIAAMVGYESLSHFISVFEKYYSISPYKYRKNFKTNE